MNSLLEIALIAAVEAGKEIIKAYSGDNRVQFKDDHSPLTVADIRSNEKINDFLRKTSIPIISEENKSIPYQLRKDWYECWIVDPLDGTKEFIKRNGEFTVNIALVQDSKPKLGVIYVPISKELYFADVQNKICSKAVVNDERNTRALVMESLALKSGEFNSDKIRVAGSRSHMNDDTVQFIDNLKARYKETEIISKGSSLKFCLLAEGKADVYPRFGPTMEWDTAAGDAICQAAGFRVVVKETDQPLRYNKENLLNPSFLVYKR